MLDFAPKLYERRLDMGVEIDQSEPLIGPETPTIDPDKVSAPPVLSFGTMSLLRKAKAYQLRTEDGLLFLDLRSKKGVRDPRVGQIGPATILNFSNKRIGMVSPIILDLDGDGLELRSRKKSKASFDMDGDGRADDTGWVGRDDGLLVIDRNGDGKITSASEISFLSEDPNASSDLDALSRLDSNRDSIIDASDERFAELKIWRDRNGNGVSDPGEARSLADHNIKSISLSALAVNSTVKLGSNALLATSTFTRIDGSVGTVGDVALAFRPSSRGPAGSGGNDLPSNRSEDGLPFPHERFDDFRPEPEASRPLLGSHFMANPQGSISGSSSDLAAPLPRSSTGYDDIAGAEPALPELPAGDGGVDLDYTMRIDLANARLVQALASFGETAPMMARAGEYLGDYSGQSEWMTVASLPSVRRLLTTG